MACAWVPTSEGRDMTMSYGMRDAPLLGVPDRSRAFYIEHLHYLKDSITKHTEHVHVYIIYNGIHPS